VTWTGCAQAEESAPLKLDAPEQFSRAVVAELKRVRVAKGFSQGSLSQATGLSRSAITMIENGQRNPTLIVCQALAAALGVRLSSVLRRVEKATIAGVS
jgi:XRE family transcriptional regulator, fatty acid utilization regulator